MEKLIVNVNVKQKETLVKLFEMLQLKVEIESEYPDEPDGSQEKLKTALDSCSGMWKDKEVDFKEFRAQAWGGRGI